MATLKPEDKLFTAMAYTIDKKPKETLAVIRRNGILLPSNASRKDIQGAVASLSMRSKPFWKDFSLLVQKTGEENFKGFVHADGTQGLNDSVKDSKSKEKKDYADSTLGKVFTPDFIQNILGTGVQVWANKQNSKAGVSGVNNDINSGRSNYSNEVSGSSGDGTGNPPPSKGIGTTGIILISVGAIALIGTVVYFAMKSKKGK